MTTIKIGDDEITVNKPEGITNVFITPRFLGDYGMATMETDEGEKQERLAVLMEWDGHTYLRDTDEPHCWPFKGAV